MNAHKVMTTTNEYSIVIYWSVFITGNYNHCHNSALFLICTYTTDITLCRRHHLLCTLLWTHPPSHT